MIANKSGFKINIKMEVLKIFIVLCLLIVYSLQIYNKISKSINKNNYSYWPTIIKRID